MSMFDSVINEAGEKFNLGGKAGTLLSALLALMTDKNRGGFAGFLENFNRAGLSDTITSWIGTGSNTPISDEQIESVLGEDTLRGIANATKTDYAIVTSATAYMTPRVIDALTPDGVVPADSDLLSKIGGYLTGIGGAASGGIGTAAAMTGGIPDKADATVGGADYATRGTVGSGINAASDAPDAVGDRFGTALNSVGERVDDDADNDSILKWLLPLLLLGLLLTLGYMFCSKSTPVITTAADDTADNKFKNRRVEYKTADGNLLTATTTNTNTGR